MQPLSRVRLVKIIMVLCAMTCALGIKADPDWLKENMTINDCADLHWREQPMCQLQALGQRYQHLKSALMARIQQAPAEVSCEQATAIGLFEARERAWEQLALAHCQLAVFCEQQCGSGHSAVIAHCYVRQTAQRTEVLKKELVAGLQVYGCSMNLKAP